MQRDGTLGFVRQSLHCTHSHLVYYTEASERAPLLLLNHAPPLTRLPFQTGHQGNSLTSGLLLVVQECASSLHYAMQQCLPVLG